jgi:hypothetical protein
LLIGGTGANTTLLKSAHALTVTLGEPIFVEKGSDTTQREIGPNRTQYTFTTNGTMNGNIEYSKAGEWVSVSKGNNVTFDQGHGVLTTKDGSETANFTFIEVGNGTAYQGASAYSTNSTGKLSSLNNILVVFKIGEDGVATFWHWK